MEELTPPQIAEALGVSAKSVQLWLRGGSLKGRRSFSGFWLVKVADIRAFVRSRPYAREETEAMLNAWLDKRYGRADAHGRHTVPA